MNKSDTNSRLLYSYFKSGNMNHAKPPLFVNEGDDWLVIDSKGLQDDEIPSDSINYYEAVNNYT